ncbi:MAG: hypothetical protein RIC80_22190, partial [Cyclobacteriaceae bacterium]
MIANKFNCILISITLMCLMTHGLLAQTAGEIFTPSTDYNGGGQWVYPYTPLDPDGDGWVIDDGDAFLDPGQNDPSGAQQTAFDTDETDFELAFIPIPQLEDEPDGDPVKGGSCGQSDVVDDDDGSDTESSYVFFYNHPVEGDILVYRIRLAINANGNFGYSVLMDTDGNIGADDPGDATGNPGFEFEVRFKTGGNGDGIYIDDVDDRTTGFTTQAYYPLTTNVHRAYASPNITNCAGDDPVFYDFWIPLSDLGVDSRTGVRLAAGTSNNGTSILGNNASDIAGVDDGNIGTTYPLQDDALEALINLQQSTPIDNLGEGGCFLTSEFTAPVVNTPIFDSQGTITGTSVEDAGTTINIFRNDTLWGSTTVDVGGSPRTWSYTHTDSIFTGLRPFDEIEVEVIEECVGAASAAIINVVNDLDSDGDGILDTSESENGVDPGADADGDNIPNFRDPDYPGYVDSDGDGINDLFDKDLDGIPDHFDLDSDSDGIPDLVEAGGTDADGDGQLDDLTDTDGDGLADTVDPDNAGTALTISDTDGDGIINSLDLDSDGDGISDIVEAGGTDSDGDGQLDDLTDTDGDGLADTVDPDNAGTALTIPDSEASADGIPDYLDADSDDDGIPDNVEAQTSAAYLAPSGNDTDGDGLDDSYDPDQNSAIDPVNTNSPDDAIPDYLDPDSDGDGVPDIIEGHDANRDGFGDWDDDNDNIVDVGEGSADTDGDGLIDAFDTDNGGSDATLQDTDGDAAPDFRDTDDDNDGTITGDGTNGSGEDQNNNGDWSDDFTEGGGVVPDYLFNPDFDGDGNNDDADLDSDNDGILDEDEDGGSGFDPSGDEDSDGILNYLDTDDGDFTGIDSNGDGIVDIFDTDLDGLPDFQDADSDNDGIVDLIEAGGTDSDGDGQIDGNINGANDANNDGIDDTIGVGGLSNPDSDSDGIPDAIDLDSDNDGIVDNIEGQTTAGYVAPSGIDADNNGVDDAYDASPIDPDDANTDGTDDPDYLDDDSDNDGVEDIIEGHDGNNDGDGDWDTNGNGSVNGSEGTGDGDGDGILDAFDPDNGGTAAVLRDTDGDGEYDFRDDNDDGDGTITGDGTNGSGEDANGNGQWDDDFTDGGGVIPDYLFNPDFDGDGIDDDTDLDSDNDGILDAEEDSGTGFDPTADADSDGIPNYLDQDDVTASFPPFVDSNGDGINDAYDTDLDGIPDFHDLDSDNDGLYDIIEAGGTDDGDGQVDGNIAGANDGNNDGIDDTIGVGGLANPDTDADGVANAFDVDSDNDGVPDIVENGGTDANNDGRADSTTDTDQDGIADIFDTDNGGTGLTEVESLLDADTTPNYLDIDSDGDGIADIIEAGGVDSGTADGRVDDVTDTDGDGLADTFDADNGGSPLTNLDFDGDGFINGLDLDSDNDGITDNVEANADGATGGTLLTPRNTDGKTKPDYLDTDSDNDGIPDIIEGHDSDQDGEGDWDTNNNGIVDGAEGITDTDSDGLLDAFDTDNGGTAAVLQNTNSPDDTVPDFRDTDDDGDGIPTIDEPLDLRPNNGTPDYLEDTNSAACGLGFIQNDLVGNADAVDSSDGATNPDNILGGADDEFVELATSNKNADVSTPADDFIIVDLGVIIPEDTILTIRFRSSASAKSVTMDVSGSLTNSGFANSQDYSTSSTTYSNVTYTVAATNGIRYLRLVFSNEGNGNPELQIDAINYAFTFCDPDTDNDGYPDDEDPDDDNDGISDTRDGNVTGVDPSADADSDGTPNYLDTDLPQCGVLVNGVCTNFDFDRDGIPNHLDLDSDNDGIPDAVEANGGSLPATMQSDGEYSISTVLSNDNNDNGLHNAYDAGDGGEGTFGVLDTDSDGSPDFLDRNSDDDTYESTGFSAYDFIEANDPVGDDDDALDELKALAVAFNTAFGSDRYDNSLDDDSDGIPNW